MVQGLTSTSFPGDGKKRAPGSEVGPAHCHYVVSLEEELSFISSSFFTQRHTAGGNPPMD